MLTWEDCVGLAELSEAEIAILAEHEHIPQMAALELGQYLVEHEGCRRIRRMIADDIEAARGRGDYVEVLKLRLVLKHFIDGHREHLEREQAVHAM